MDLADAIWNQTKHPTVALVELEPIVDLEEPLLKVVPQVHFLSGIVLKSRVSRK